MVKKINTRLVLATLSTLLQEIALVGIVLWGLPKVGIQIPLAGLVALMVALAALAIYIYRLGSRALEKKPVAGLETMVGSRGRVVSPLAPEGTIRISGELWAATSVKKRINAGEEVIVVRQDRLKLIVCRISPDN